MAFLLPRNGRQARERQTRFVHSDRMWTRRDKRRTFRAKLIFSCVCVRITVCENVLALCLPADAGYHTLAAHLEAKIAPDN